MKYALGLEKDQELYYGNQYDTFEDAREAGIKQVIEFNKGEQDYAGVFGNPMFRSSDFPITKLYVVEAITPDIDSQTIAEDITAGLNDYMYGNYGEVAEEYLMDMTDEETKSLGETIYQWFKDHKRLPDFWVAGKQVEIDLDTGKNTAVK